MAYGSLAKLFYEMPQQYENIYQMRYSDSNTIHLNFQIHESPAFLCQNVEIYKYLLEIQKINGRIRQVRQDLPGVAIQQFARRCLIDEIVITNDIEGVNSTRREIHAVLDKAEDHKTKIRFEGQVQKYLMLQSAQDIPLKTCQDIRNLYNDLVLSEVQQEDAENVPDGKYFRKSSVSVTNSSQREIHRGVYPEESIISCMDAALTFLNDSQWESLLRISAFHYLFGYIHPFYDGNGRLSRFISSYLLSQQLDSLIGYRLSYTIKEHIKDYYDAFKVVNDIHNRGDITPFVVTFLKIIQESMLQLESALEKRSKNLALYKSILEQNQILQQEEYHPIAYLLLQAGLFSEDGISTSDLLQYAHCSPVTLRKRLTVLMEHHYALVKKHGRTKFYRLNFDAFPNPTTDQ